MDGDDSSEIAPASSSPFNRDGHRKVDKTKLLLPTLDDLQHIRMLFASNTEGYHTFRCRISSLPPYPTASSISYASQTGRFSFAPTSAASLSRCSSRQVYLTTLTFDRIDRCTPHARIYLRLCALLLLHARRPLFTTLQCKAQLLLLRWSLHRSPEPKGLFVVGATIAAPHLTSRRRGPAVGLPSVAPSLPLTAYGNSLLPVLMLSFEVVTLRALIIDDRIMRSTLPLIKSS
jgi:hypothetical protein